MNPFKALLLRKTGSAITVNLDSITVTDTVTDPTNAEVIMAFKTDRTVEATAGGVLAETFSWLSSGGTVGNYELKVTTTVGSFSTGTANVWQRLDSNRTFTVLRTTAGTKAVSGIMQIRLFGGDGTILAEEPFSLEAVVNSDL